MAVNAGSVYAELILDTSKYEKALNNAEKQTNDLAKKLEKTGKSIEKAGDKLSKYVTAPILGAGVAATKLGMDFEAGMSRVQAISGATGAELEKLNEVALDHGANTAFSASEVAMAMENLASAGFETNEIIAALPGNLDLAASSGTDLAVATDIAASILRGFQLDAAEAGRVADVLAEAANRTNAGVEDMGEAMKYIAPVANAMGLSLEETAAAVGILADAGIKGSQAGTTLRGALTRLTKPTDDMVAVMERLGVEFFDAEGNMKSMAEIISELEKGTKGLTQEQRNQALATLFGQEALSGMLVLIEKGPDALEELTKGFENSSGAAKAAADIMMNNTKGAVEEMMGALETAGIKIFNSIAPTITDLATKVGELADKFSTLPEETQKSIIKFAALAAAIGPVLSIGGKLTSGVGTAIKLFGKLSTATTASTTVVASLGNAAAIGTAKVAGLGVAAKVGTALLSPWTAAIAAGEVAVYGLYKHLSQDVIPAVELFTHEVSESTQQAVSSYLELEEQATMALKQMSWSGQEVTEEMKNKIVSNIDEMKNQVVTKLEDQKNEALVTMEEMVSNSIELTEEEKEEILRITQETYDKQIHSNEVRSREINQILERASEERRQLTQEERDRILELQERMRKDAIKILSESEAEQMAILERLKANSTELSARQAAEIVKNSKEQKEKTIAEAETEYTERLKYAAQLRAMGGRKPKN